MRRSLMPIPCTYLLGGIVLGILAPTVDSSLNSSVAPGVGVAAARDILTSTATGMIAFTGLVVSSVLVTVQFAAGQYSPRLVLWFRRDRLVKNAIGSFLAAPVFALVALRQIEVGRTSHRQDVTVVVALVLLIAAGILFLALLQRVIDGLRPRALYAAVTRVGLRSIRAVYPDRLGAHGDDRPGPSVIGEPASRPVVLRGKPGVVTSLDLDLMLRFAVETDAELELVCAVGEFVDRGQTVLRLHGEFEDDTYDSALLAAIDVSEERTIDQDPELAIRIIVDTAIRALSPAANDPATAVHAIDAGGRRPTGATCSSSPSTSCAPTGPAPCKCVAACAPPSRTSGRRPRRFATPCSTSTCAGCGPASCSPFPRARLICRSPWGPTGSGWATRGRRSGWVIDAASQGLRVGQ
jgi:uncharacterized membrane protein